MSMSGGPVDRAVLEDLAASSRILADQGVFDAAGHVSMRQATSRCDIRAVRIAF